MFTIMGLDRGPDTGRDPDLLVTAEELEFLLKEKKVKIEATFIRSAMVEQLYRFHNPRRFELKEEK